MEKLYQNMTFQIHYLLQDATLEAFLLNIYNDTMLFPWWYAQTGVNVDRSTRCFCYTGSPVRNRQCHGTTEIGYPDKRQKGCPYK